MVDRRKRAHREMLERLPREHPQVIKAWIPASSSIESSPAQGTPFVTGKRSSPAALAYRNLWTEVQKTAMGNRVSGR
jgi:cellulose biosynthesis protein BcsQ